MTNDGGATLDELLYSRRLADGKRIEVHRIAGEIIVRLFNAQGLHHASHISRNGDEAVQAAMHWNGTGYPFVE
jgi:hypothetical protein